MYTARLISARVRARANGLRTFQTWVIADVGIVHVELDADRAVVAHEFDGNATPWNQVAVDWLLEQIRASGGVGTYFYAQAAAANARPPAPRLRWRAVRRHVPLGLALAFDAFSFVHLIRSLG